MSEHQPSLEKMLRNTGFGVSSTAHGNYLRVCGEETSVLLKPEAQFMVRFRSDAVRANELLAIFGVVAEFVDKSL